TPKFVAARGANRGALQAGLQSPVSFARIAANSKKLPLFGRRLPGAAGERSRLSVPRSRTHRQDVVGVYRLRPRSLPPRIDYDESLVVALSRADAALSELSGLARYLPNPHLLIASYVRREAVLSSRIEGTRVSLSELLLGEVAEPQPERD